MAGGRGTRLQPLTDDRPKPMVPLLGRPVIDYVKDAMLRAGVNDLVVTTGYRGEDLEAHVNTWDADGVRAQLITPPGPLDQGTLVAFHGGGFIVCSAATHAKAFGLMGAASRLRVLNVDYRLAPEHRFPAAHDDCLRATRWAARALHRDDVLIGDSVGGNLSLSIGAQLIGDAEVTVRGIVSISPLTDFTLSSPSLTTRRARDPFTYCAGLPELRQMYLGEDEALARDPRASPLFADVRGLAPTLVQMGSEEICYDDGLRMAEKIHAAGGRVRFEEWQGMFHTWHHYAGALSGADEAIEAIGAWVRWCIGMRELDFSRSR